MFCPVVQCRSTTLRRYGGAPYLSTAEEECLVLAGPAEGGLCLALYNSHLFELVKTVKVRSLTLLDRQEKTACDKFVLPWEQAPWGLVFALLALCPLHIGVTWPFQAQRGMWSQNFPDLLMLPLRCLPLGFPVTPGLHSWKSRRGWVEYPWGTSPKSHLLNSSD